VPDVVEGFEELEDSSGAVAREVADVRHAALFSMLCAIRREAQFPVDGQRS
jgi:hypothetical protein